MSGLGPDIAWYAMVSACYLFLFCLCDLFREHLLSYGSVSHCFSLSHNQFCLFEKLFYINFHNIKNLAIWKKRNIEIPIIAQGYVSCFDTAVDHFHFPVLGRVVVSQPGWVVFFKFSDFLHYGRPQLANIHT